MIVLVMCVRSFFLILILVIFSVLLSVCLSRVIGCFGSFIRIMFLIWCCCVMVRLRMVIWCFFCWCCSGKLVVWWCRFWVEFGGCCLGVCYDLFVGFVLGV